MAWTAFAALTAATGQELDTNFLDTFNGGSYPGTLSGTNSLALAITGEAPTIAALVNGQTFYGIAANTNTTAVTLAAGSFSALQVYKDSSAGPIVLSGGEIVASCACWFTYDSTLNAGSGGYHLRTGGAILNGQTINPTALKVGTGAVLTAMLSAQRTVTFGNTAAQSSDDQNVSLASVATGDVIQLGPPVSVAVGVSYMGYVPAAGTVTIRAINVTAASLTPTGGLFRVAAMRFT